MTNFKTLPLNINHQKKILNFSDQFIGKNYFNKTNFPQQINLSQKNNLNCSFVLKDEAMEIIGIRITYAPGSWLNEVKTKYIKNKSIKLNQIAYFKSLFIHPNYQKKGLGPLLSRESIKVLKKMNTTHILSHSWKESPNNSSVRYLEKSGFTSLGEIPNFWSSINYICSGCMLSSCKCTAVEMILKI